MKERRQVLAQAPRIAALPQLIHDGARDGVPVFLRQGPGAALRLDSSERERERVHKLVGSVLQNAPDLVVNWLA